MHIQTLCTLVYVEECTITELSYLLAKLIYTVISILLLTKSFVAQFHSIPASVHHVILYATRVSNFVGIAIPKIRQTRNV